VGVLEFKARLETARWPLELEMLSELSGLHTDEASLLAQEWAEWSHSRLRQLLKQLVQVNEKDGTLEFEVVFKFALRSTDGAARVLAVNGLRNSRDRTLISFMIELLLYDDHIAVREAAAEALAHFCVMAADHRLHVHDDQRLRRALYSIANSSADPPNLKHLALEAVAVLEGPDVTELIKTAYKDERVDTRQSALRAMGRNGDSGWLNIVLSELDSPDTGIRYAGTIALGLLGNEEHVITLGSLLDDQDLDVQMAAVGSLIQIGGAEAEVLLAAAMQSSEPSVSQAAAEGIQELMDAEALLDPIPRKEVSESGGLWGAPSNQGSKDLDERDGEKHTHGLAIDENIGLMDHDESEFGGW